MQRALIYPRVLGTKAGPRTCLTIWRFNPCTAMPRKIKKKASNIKTEKQKTEKNLRQLLVYASVGQKPRFIPTGRDILLSVYPVPWLPFMCPFLVSYYGNSYWDRLHATCEQKSFLLGKWKPLQLNFHLTFEWNLNWSQIAYYMF